MTLPLAPALMAVIAISLCSPTLDARTKSGGEVSLSSRIFSPDDDEQTKDWGLTTDARLEFKAKQNGGFRQEVRVLGRAAGYDEDRSTLIVEEAWVGWKGETVELILGSRLINWSATEAFHPADIINSRNLDSDIENAEKLGEPMASVRFRFGQGGVSGFFMPVRLAPRLPGPRSRLSLAGGQAVGDALWLERDGDLDTSLWGSQWALRLDQTFGGLDLALHYVDHQDRSQPAIVLDPAAGRIHPAYRRVQRVGGTFAQVLGEWLIKAEIDHRWFETIGSDTGYQIISAGAQDHTAVAAGLEWGWGYASGSEGIILVEGQWAIASDVSEEELEAMGPFQRDVLIGYRHAWNDVEGTEGLAGLIIDTRRSNELIGNVTLSRRMNDEWSLRGALRFIHAPDTKSLLNGQHEAHSFQFDLTRSF